MRVSLVFQKKVALNTTSYSFYFAKPSGFIFQAGQYLQVSFSHDETFGSRFFTIASAPSEEMLMITTKRSQSLFKKKLFSLKKGESITGFGPMGTFGTKV